MVIAYDCVSPNRAKRCSSKMSRNVAVCLAFLEFTKRSHRPRRCPEMSDLALRRFREINVLLSIIASFAEQRQNVRTSAQTANRHHLRYRPIPIADHAYVEVRDEDG